MKRNFHIEIIVLIVMLATSITLTYLTIINRDEIRETSRMLLQPQENMIHIWLKGTIAMQNYSALK